MTQRSEKERLLSDVLAEGEPSGSRAGLLTDLLGQVRRRRRIRNAGRAAVTLFIAALIIFPFWKRPILAPASPPPVQGHIEVVTTQPLPAAALVRTSRLADELVIGSVAMTATIVTVKGIGNFRVIDDAELFALLGSHPAALVHGPAGTAQLIFVNPHEQYGFPVN